MGIVDPVSGVVLAQRKARTKHSSLKAIENDWEVSTTDRDQI